ncbi:hypothetical protein NLG07_00485 [Alteromonas sp. LMIT006]|uniref:hypothetical protein n=1 Tax=Alteromonadaceae TaxID=72275 RepID=UPI0020CA291A|nr:hypothetical protein [Alteromonas sp. LMIT006]UTP72750.1 hypothetical protein NLG07_00485 [Alteromonas sp. LMIT006]
MCFFNPYPSNYKSHPLEIKRLLPLLELIWNGDNFDIIYGIPYINDHAIKIKETKPIVAAIAHLLEVPITLLESTSPSIKGATGRSFSSQTLHHTDLNKNELIGQTFNLNQKTKCGKTPKYFGCHSKRKNTALQKFWRKCGFPEPDRWSRLPVSIIGTKFLTGHLTTYKNTGNLKYINDTVETVFLTNEQILEAVPTSIKVEKGNTDLKQILYRNDTTPSRLLPTHNTFHVNKQSPQRTIITGLEQDISACSNKHISHFQSQGGNTKSYFYDKYDELDGSPF